MSRIFVHGWGAVSPAGWCANLLAEVVQRGVPLPANELPRPGCTPLKVRRVPAANPRPAWLAQPRLRRSSSISHFAVGAALEALHGQPASAGPRSLGVICTVMGGGVAYSRRFYEEVLSEPSTASPLLFPETVFNAPASHLSSVLGSIAPNDTLVGDQTGFVQALAFAADWLNQGRVDACLVVATEEADWLTAEAARLFQPRVPAAEGAGALLLRREPGPVELTAVTQPELFVAGRSRREAVDAMHQRLTAIAPDAVTFESAPVALADHSGRRQSHALVPVIGDGFAAAGGWTCVSAVDAIARGGLATAAASVVGANLQAIGAVFSRA